MKLNSAPDLSRLRESLSSHNGKPELILSSDATCCLLRGSKGVAEALGIPISEIPT